MIFYDERGGNKKWRERKNRKAKIQSFSLFLSLNKTLSIRLSSFKSFSDTFSLAIVAKERVDNRSSES